MLEKARTMVAMRIGSKGREGSLEGGGEAGLWNGKWGAEVKQI